VAAQVEDQLGKLESGTAGKTPAPGVSAARGVATVHSWLNQVYGTLDSADAAPTVQALAMLSEVEKVLTQQLNEIKQIQAGSLAELNQKLRQVGTKEISQSHDVETAAPQARRGQRSRRASMFRRRRPRTAEGGPSLRGACPPPSPASNLIDGHPIPNAGIQRPADPEAPRPKALRFRVVWIPRACLMPSESLQSLGGSCAPKELPSHAVFRFCAPAP